ncbi:MATE family efflux transporter [Streptomyces avermitilis]|uniref:MATE family efflux transporter n=1 Tax=Streptomyces avermitilis TaxID=33903 RepID=UPI00382A3670
MPLSDGPALPLAVGYFAISLPGIAVFHVQNLLDGILKGAGDTRTPTRLALLANGLISALDPLLIHRYGVRGAASTVLCRRAALGVGLLALRRNALLRAAAAARPSEVTGAAPRGAGAHPCCCG